MKTIKTKCYAKTNNGDYKYLIYLYDGATIISCTDAVGELEKTKEESKLLTKNPTIEAVQNISLEQFVDNNDMSITQKGTPLVIVFYLERELLQNAEIAGPFVQTINDILLNRDANAIALFLATEGNERVECVNPQIANPEQKEKIDALIAKLESDFEIGNTNNLNNESTSEK